MGMNEGIPNGWGILPSKIRYCKELSSTAKLLYCEINCLTNKFGYSFAKNKYFADLYDLSEDRISKLIHQLEKLGFIKVVLTRSDVNSFVTDRKIYIVQEALFESEEQDDEVKNNESVVKNNYDDQLKITDPVVKNDGTNNITSNKITINNITPKKTQTFSRDDYSECRNIINKNKEYLTSQGIRIEQAAYSITELNSFIKSKFKTHGVDDTKKGLINSVNNDWLKSIGYSMNGLFSSKMFPKYIANEQSISNGIVYQPRFQQVFDDKKERTYDNIEEGRF